MAKRAVPYVPGLQVNDKEIIKLNTNENAYPPSPKVIEAIQAETNKLHLYPSPTAEVLRGQIGAYYQLSPEEVFVGNGSDEVLAFAFMTFFEPSKKIRFPNITYSFYPVYAKLFNIPFEEVPVNDDFSLPIDKFFKSEGGVIIPNPNAPTSVYASLEHIEKIAKNNPDHVVIIDEAYVDFAEQSAAGLVRKYDNLLIVQTTSKSRALAGLRVGFALAHPELIEGLVRIKDSINSYTLDRLALVGAKAAFQDEAYFIDVTNRIIVTRNHVIERMEQLKFNVLPSQTNFVFATHPDFAASYLYTELKREGILVRYFDKHPIDNYLRISIGTDEDMELFFKKLEKVMNES